MTRQRVGATVGLLVTAAALLLQFWLTIPTRMATGDSLVGSLVFFFSYFTILTNMMVAAVYLSAVTGWRWLGWWRRPWVRAMVAGSILVVMIVYHLLLAGLVRDEFLWQLADRTLHYVDPLLYAVWWLLAVPHGTLRWGDLPRMLVYPGAYLLWALGRGAVTSLYPYPFVDVTALGYGQVVLNCLGVLAAFVLFYAAAIGVDRWLGRRSLRAV